MTKPELAAAIAERAGLSKKDAAKTIDAFVNVVTEELKAGGKVQIIGFGTFETSIHKAGTARNPRTGEAVPYGESKIPRFKVGKAWKDAMNVKEETTATAE